MSFCVFPLIPPLGLCSASGAQFSRWISFSVETQPFLSGECSSPADLPLRFEEHVSDFSWDLLQRSRSSLLKTLQSWAWGVHKNEPLAKPHLFNSNSSHQQTRLRAFYLQILVERWVRWLICVYWSVWAVSGSLRLSFKWEKIPAKSDSTPTRCESLSRNQLLSY